MSVGSAAINDLRVFISCGECFYLLVAQVSQIWVIEAQKQKRSHQRWLCETHGGYIRKVVASEKVSLLFSAEAAQTSQRVFQEVYQASA